MKASEPAFGLLVVGTEILIGRRRDAHLPFMIDTLAARGLELAWVRIVGDDPWRLERVLAESMAGDDVVFCFGGIGATPDDHTRAAAARAAGVTLELHAAAVVEIETRFGEQARPQRIRMAELPRGARLIPNPVNRIPGFSLGRHHFVPGFPQMGWPMAEWVLEHEYAALAQREPLAERLLTLPGTSEGQVIDLLEAFVARFPAVQFSCLPHFDGDYRETELGVRGGCDLVEQAAAWLCEGLSARGVAWQTGGARQERRR